MATWAEFAAAAPDLAERGKHLLSRFGDGSVLLATVRDADLPRLHPVSVGVVDDGLYAFIIERSPKNRDLERDGRYALYAQQDPDHPNEFSLRGRARLITDANVRTPIGGDWFFEADDTFSLFEFDIEHALLGAREDRNAWPPRYTSSS